MYKVLIADDEDIIRRGIRMFLSKCPMLDVVALAEDGEEALDMAKEHKPDLLFVDINMPFLNGLDFIAQLGGVLEDPIVIIITGYDNFKYAQSALRLKVFDYILKPLMEEVFYEAIERALLALEDRENSKKFKEQTKELFEQKKEIFREEFLEDWMSQSFSETEAAERMDYLEIQLPEKELGVFIIQKEKNYEARNADRWTEELLGFALRNIVGEIAIPLSPFYLFENIRGSLVGICSCKNQKKWEEFSENIRTEVREILPIHIHINCRICHELYEAPSIYQELLSENDKRNENPGLVNDILEYLNSNYQDTELNLQRLSSQMHVSSQYMSRIFKRSTGVTIMEYLTRVRMKQAVKLLTKTNLKMYEIAEQAGYNNQHYFSNAFKKVQGMSPNEFRKEI